jgi:hypothetical protein
MYVLQLTTSSSQTIIPKNIILPLVPLHAHQVTMFQWRKLYLRKVVKEQFVLAFSYQFLKVITSTSMLVILRWHLCKFLTLTWNLNTPKNCLANKITFGNLLACSIHQVRHLTTSFSDTRKPWNINTLKHKVKFH